MASLSEPRPHNVEINYDEPARRSAPLLTVGPLAWIRKNLFSTVFDTILTILFFGLIIGGIIGLLTWSVVEANWFVITRNLRLYMLGSFEPEFQWRVELAFLITVFVVGFSIGAWARLSRYVAIVLAVIALAIAVVPPVSYATTPLAHSYLVASNAPIAAGTVTVAPIPALAFIARGGETISIQVATGTGADDASLSHLAGFADRGAEAIANSAINRQAAEARMAEIDAQLANPTGLTERQVARLQEERTALEATLNAAPVPITESITLNQTPVMLQVIRADTMEVIGETTLTTETGVWSLQLPVDGWYVLNKTVESPEGVTLLETTGIYPILERSITIPLATGGSTQVSEFVRINDDLEVTAERPEIDGADVPFMVIIDHQYKGERPITDWLRLHVAPFLSWSGRLILPLMAVAVIGYLVAQGMRRLPANPGAQNWSSVYPMSEARTYALTSNKAAFIASRAWIILPFVFWILVAGIGGPLPFTDVERWGGLLLTIVLAAVGIVASFPLGVLLALGRRSDLPVVRWVSTVYIEVVRGVPLITVLFMAQLLVPLINPSLAEIKGVYRAMVGITLFSAAYLAENIRGGLQAIPHGQEEAAKALGLNGFQSTLFITLPQALRLVIPALVGQFISLFKDTSLVAIVGLIDLVGISRAVTSQTEFNGLQTESYVFIAVIYLLFCYTMGVISRRIEASGSGAARRV